MTDQASCLEAETEDESDDLASIQAAQPRLSFNMDYWPEAREAASTKLDEMDPSKKEIHRVLGLDSPPFPSPTKAYAERGIHPESDVVEALRSEDHVREQRRLEEEASRRLEQARLDSANELATAHNQAFTEAFRLVTKFLTKANLAYEQGQHEVAKSLVLQSKDVLGIFEQGLA